MKMLWSKKSIAMVLIIAMVLTNAGFATLAESIDDVTKVSENNEKPSSGKYAVGEDTDVVGGGGYRCRRGGYRCRRGGYHPPII